MRGQETGRLKKVRRAECSQEINGKKGHLLAGGRVCVALSLVIALGVGGNSEDLKRTSQCKQHARRGGGGWQVALTDVIT